MLSVSPGVVWHWSCGSGSALIKDLQIDSQRLQDALFDGGLVRLRRSDATLQTQRFFRDWRVF